MLAHGFTAGKYSPCTYLHSVWGIKVLVHGDDFVSSGTRDALQWFKSKLDARFEIKSKVVGGAEGEVTETRILNRVVRVTPEGWVLEYKHLSYVHNYICRIIEMLRS